MAGCLPSKNPEPRRPILKNLKFSSFDTVNPDILDQFRLSKHATQVIVKQCVFYCSCVADACFKTKKRFSVGFIGCGRIGRLILGQLLENGVQPKNVLVSTRRPEILQKYQHRGVRCVSDNAVVAKKSRIIFLCTLPSQVKLVSTEVRGSMRRTTILVSIVAALSALKLQQLFGTAAEQTLRTAVDILALGRALRGRPAGRSTREARGGQGSIGPTEALPRAGRPEVHGLGRVSAARRGRGQGGGRRGGGGGGGGAHALGHDALCRLAADQLLSVQGGVCVTRLLAAVEYMLLRLGYGERARVPTPAPRARAGARATGPGSRSSACSERPRITRRRADEGRRTPGTRPRRGSNFRRGARMAVRPVVPRAPARAARRADAPGVRHSGRARQGEVPERGHLQPVVEGLSAAPRLRRGPRRGPFADRSRVRGLGSRRRGGMEGKTSMRASRTEKGSGASLCIEYRERRCSGLLACPSRPSPPQRFRPNVFEG